MRPALCHATVTRATPAAAATSSAVRRSPSAYRHEAAQPGSAQRRHRNDPSDSVRYGQAVRREHDRRVVADGGRQGRDGRADAVREQRDERGVIVVALDERERRHAAGDRGLHALLVRGGSTSPTNAAPLRRPPRARSRPRACGRPRPRSTAGSASYRRRSGNAPAPARSARPRPRRPAAGSSRAAGTGSRSLRSGREARRGVPARAGGRRGCPCSSARCPPARRRFRRP